MPLSQSIGDREFQKFDDGGVDSGNNKLANVRVSLVASALVSLAEKILNASDRNDAFTWADFGKKTERVTQIDYTAASVSAQTLRKTFPIHS